MYTIIVGGGKVGFYLAKEMLEEGHEVLIIEKDEHGPRSAQIQKELGDVVLKGDGCEATTLESAGAGRADMLIAVTGDDEDNLVACQVAKNRFLVGRTVARINNPKNEQIFRKLGIDVTVSATNAILHQIEQELPTYRLVPLVHLRGSSGLELVEVKIPPSARVVGQHASELLLPQGVIISLIVDAEGNPRLPGDSVLRAEDEVIAITRIGSEEQLRRALTE
ncbi:MAG: TrkA family potassium uptake protein [Dehalococcoidia bacterium]